MSKIAEKTVAAQVAITGYVAGVFDRMRSDERGQGSVEYVGIIIVVAIILVAVIAAVKSTDLGTKLVTKITDAIDTIK